MEACDARVQPPVEKRPRKVNFTSVEITTMLEEIAENKEVIQSKFQTSVTHRKKTDAWKRVAEAVTACGIACRSVEDVKKKWMGVKSDTLANMRGQKKTGGGPAERPPAYADIVFGIIGDQSDAVYGIDGKPHVAMFIINIIIVIFLIR